MIFPTQFSFRGHLAGLLAAVSLIPSALADRDPVGAFVAQGTVTRYSYRRGEINAPDRQDAVFTFFHTNGWWKAEVKHLTPSAGSLALESCMSVPGGVRKFTLFENDQRKGVIGAEVCPTPFPPPGLTFLFATWLSLCPNPALPLIDGQRMRGFPNVPECRLSLLNHAANEATYKLDYLGPGLAFVSRLVMTNNGVSLEIASGEEDAIQPFWPPYDRGFAQHDYQVTQTTNFNGIAFPLRAVLKRFHPKLGDASASTDLGLSVLTELAVTNLSELQPGGPTESSAPCRLLALDARPPRLSPQQRVHYFVTNDVWRPVSDPMIQELTRIELCRPWTSNTPSGNNKRR
jgi:hypothetical protein